ncbi:hypothetical protein [uncultured Mucilaginibacter sp.]|uniref:hypothetical protein n=1 Tax=uncultured Mucilaginibacter sp. TaxID=797541 RepID=UPI0025F8E63E|nr:hypothetical protein [uncultured Mucilaginibacter sp.]
MKRLFILSALVITAGVTNASATPDVRVKPGTAANTTVAALKLAEAKAVLSKASSKSVKAILGTADGGR